MKTKRKPQYRAYWQTVGQYQVILGVVVTVFLVAFGISWITATVSVIIGLVAFFVGIFSSREILNIGLASTGASITTAIFISIAAFLIKNEYVMIAIIISATIIALFTLFLISSVAKEVADSYFLKKKVVYCSYALQMAIIIMAPWPYQG